MFRGPLFILLVIYVSNSSCTIDTLYETGKELWKLYLMIDNVKWVDIDDIRDVAKLFTGNRAANKDISNQVTKIDALLMRLEKSVEPKIIRYSWKSLLSEIMINKCLDRIDILISSIDKYYGKFHQYMNETSTNFALPLKDVTQSIILDVEGWMIIVRKIIIEGDESLLEHTNLIYAITGHATAPHNTMCDNPAVISKILIDLLKIVMIAEIKFNIMVAVANIDRYAENEEWKTKNSLARQLFQEKFAIYLDIFEINTELTDSLAVRACDPENGIWIRNKDFYELEGTFQTTIFRYHWGKCALATCNNLWQNKNSNCAVEAYDDRSSCSTTVTDCFYLSAVQACVMRSGPYRFQYVNSTELGPLGTNFNCPKNNGYIIDDGTAWNWTHAACACDCYRSDNKISLLLIESRKELNMVIIGLRFFRQDKTLYIQPREGKLESDGYIRKYSERWIPIPKDSEAAKRHTIDRQNRVFFLDDLRLPPNYVLTGVKFNKATRGSVQGFAIEIFGVQFDYRSGTLNLQRGKEISKKRMGDNGEKELSFERISSVLEKTPQASVTRNESIYITLRRSKLEADFGQSTLPFFDAVPIQPRPSFLNGVGIFHKGTEGYAGFISLRVYGVPYTKYFQDFAFIHIEKGKVILDD